MLFTTAFFRLDASRIWKVHFTTACWRLDTSGIWKMLLTTSFCRLDASWIWKMHFTTAFWRLGASGIWKMLFTIAFCRLINCGYYDNNYIPNFINVLFHTFSAILFSCNILLVVCIIWNTIMLIISMFHIIFF